MSGGTGSGPQDSTLFTAAIVGQQSALGRSCQLASSTPSSQLSSLQPSTEAKNKLIQALQGLYPEHPAVLDLEAQLALKQDNAEQAVANYKRLHERFSDNPVWTMTFARAQWQAGDREGHVATLTDWVEAHPEDVRAAYTLANSALRLNRLDLARTAFTQVLEQAPDNVPALNNLAWLLHGEAPRKALAHAEKAYALAPKQPEIADTLGWLHLQQGNTARGIELIEQAKALAPHLPDIRYHWAVALHQAGRDSEARKEIERLLRDHEDFSEIAEPRALLAQLQG